MLIHGVNRTEIKPQFCLEQFEFEEKGTFQWWHCSLTNLNHEAKRNKHVWAWMKESFFQTCEFSRQWTSLLQSVLSAQAQLGLRADLIRCEMALWPARAQPFEVSVDFLDSIVCLDQFTLSQWKTMGQEWLTLLCLVLHLRCQELFFILWFTLDGVSWRPRAGVSN